MGHRQGGAPTRGLGPLSPWGRLALLAWSWAAAMLAPDRRLPAVWAVLLLAGWLWGREGLRLWRSRGAWLIAGAALAAGAFWLDPPDRWIGGIGWSGAGLVQGAWMAARALALLAGTAAAAGGMSVSGWAGLLGAWGLPGLGFALGVAFNLLPTLRELGESAYHSIRLRGGLRRPGLALRLFLLALVANGVRYGDEVVKAATSRAFDPSRPAGPAPRLEPADGWLLGLLLLGTVGVLWR